jgi:uncharacterized SAM-binding protein YcdF (DUF218 family)
MIGIPLRQKPAIPPKNFHFGMPSIADSAMKNLLRRRSMQVPALLLMALLLLFSANAGKLLVVDDPQVSDVIVVLAGETDTRPEHALQLLNTGYAPRILLDVPAAGKIYNSTNLELAQKYVQSLPQAASISICPITGLSTRDESRDVQKCLSSQPSAKVLIVTSDFHTRRSLSIFQHEFSNKTFSVAAARDSTQFGVRWWTHRQWAKTCFDEWLRLLWWSAIERWR